jgi:hypothetical protein
MRRLVSSRPAPATRPRSPRGHQPQGLRLRQADHRGALQQHRAQKLQLTSVKVAYAPDNGSGAPGSYGSDTQLLAANFDLVTGTGDNYGQFEQDIDFTGQDQWVRIKYTPDSTAGATDVAEVAAVLVLGGTADRC